MVNFMLYITAELQNLTDFQPRGGVDDPNFTYYFKLKCENCGEVTDKETCVRLNETVPGEKEGTANLMQKCMFCNREGTITMIPGKGHPLTINFSETGKHAPLMAFDCRGFEPLAFAFRSGWKAKSLKGTPFVDIDLAGGEFAEYDNLGECVVMISNLGAEFKVVDPTTRVADMPVCLDEGVYKLVRNPGTGDISPKEGDLVKVNVRGHLDGGPLFLDQKDMEFAINGDKVTVHNGSEECVLFGMALAVMTMKIGERARVKVLAQCIPDFCVQIRGEATIVYEIEMVSFQPDLMFVDQKKKQRIWRMLYEETDEIKNLEFMDVYLLRKELGVSITGLGLVKPVKQWQQVLRQNDRQHIFKRLGELGFNEKPSDLQCQMVPLLLTGRDTIVVANSGPGLTIGFLVPLLDHLYSRRPYGTGPLALILTDSEARVKELKYTLDMYHGMIGLRYRCTHLYKGMDHKKIHHDLGLGGQVVIATPGKLWQVLTHKNLRSLVNIGEVGYVVIDNASLLVRKKELRRFVSKLVDQTREDRQMVVCSESDPDSWTEDLNNQGWLCKYVKQAVKVIKY